jgi:hypothetical protein
MYNCHLEDKVTSCTIQVENLSDFLDEERRKSESPQKNHIFLLDRQKLSVHLKRDNETSTLKSHCKPEKNKSCPKSHSEKLIILLFSNIITQHGQLLLR